MSFITLDDGELRSLKTSCHHRINKKMDQLSPTEFSFLEDMTVRLVNAKGLSEKQLSWLLAILDRTATGPASKAK